MSEQRDIRIVIVGSENTGKTQACTTYLGQENEVSKTFGVDLFTKSYQTSLKKNKLRLVMFDTSGEKQHRNSIRNLLVSIHALILFFNPNDTSQLDSWMTFINSVKEESLTKIILIKNVFINQNYENAQALSDFVKKYNLLTFEINAKEKLSVDRAFNSIAEIFQQSEQIKESQIQVASTFPWLKLTGGIGLGSLIAFALYRFMRAK